MRLAMRAFMAAMPSRNSLRSVAMSSLSAILSPLMTTVASGFSSASLKLSSSLTVSSSLPISDSSELSDVVEVCLLPLPIPLSLKYAVVMSY